MSPGTTKAPDGCEPARVDRWRSTTPCRVSSLLCAKRTAVRARICLTCAASPGDDDDLVDPAAEERVGRVRDERPAAELGEQLVSAAEPRRSAGGEQHRADAGHLQAPRRVLTISARIETASPPAPAHRWRGRRARECAPGRLGRDLRPRAAPSAARACAGAERADVEAVRAQRQARLVVDAQRGSARRRRCARRARATRARPPATRRGARRPRSGPRSRTRSVDRRPRPCSRRAARGRRAPARMRGADEDDVDHRRTGVQENAGVRLADDAADAGLQGLGDLGRCIARPAERPAAPSARRVATTSARRSRRAVRIRSSSAAARPRAARRRSRSCRRRAAPPARRSRR